MTADVMHGVASVSRSPQDSICIFAASGYRSLRKIHFPVDRLTVFVGANGVGKTNLYRALQLLQGAAAGTLARDLAVEGGMESAMAAGDRRATEPAQISLMAGFEDAGDFAYSYELSVGFPPKEAFAAFRAEPQIKSETLTLRTGRRKVVVLDRRGPSVQIRNDKGVRESFASDLMFSETALGSIEDPGRFPDLYRLRRTMLDWRFYHGFRTDQASPLRQPCLAITSPTLASEGLNLAAVFATLVHIREDTTDLDRAIDDAFPGAKLVVPVPGRHATFGLVFPEYPKRVFDVGELSDGTLRYLALAGALLAYRLPAFIALNEPETSLHPSLLAPLARLIVSAAQRSQIWLVTHSDLLADAIAEHGGITPRRVVKRDGATWLEGLKITGEFADPDD